MSVCYVCTGIVIKVWEPLLFPFPSSTRGWRFFRGRVVTSFSWKRTGACSSVWSKFSPRYPSTQGCPHPPGHRLVPVHGLLGTGLHSRRWAAGEWVKLRLYLQPLPITRITAWAPPPVRSVAALDSHRNLLWTAHVRDLGCALLMRI